MIDRPGPACLLLATLAEQLAAREDLRGEAFLAEVAAQCRQPLRVMVAGYVSAGKSTLVNALLGRESAAVARRETTAEVTWYRHPALAGQRPAGGHRAVELRFPLADRLVLIDSPGLNTESAAERSTLKLLDPDDDAGGTAAALVYLVVGEPAAEDVRRLAEFAALGPGDLGNVVLVGGKAETVSETAIKESAERRETVEEAAAKTERRLLIRRAGVRPVAVSQQLAMVARCGRVRQEHVDLVRVIVGDPELRRFAANGWDQLSRAWAERGCSDAQLAPLRALLPSLGWLAAELPSGAALDVASLTACCERVSRLAQLDQVLAELADDADLLTATTASERLRRWAVRRGSLRAAVIHEQLDLLWQQPEFTGFPRRRAALLLNTSLLAGVPAADRAWAIALLRGEPYVLAEPRAALVERWRRRTGSGVRGVLAADVAQLVVTTAGRQGAQGLRSSG
ncbi:GTPase [Kitasatospora sp. LaBMicrA B282]|uniref:GTPase n=1 Tax=Kitasatospora sp. LaBMicrA B282 TaxID=3420949 RepID=UPI003D132A6C